MRMNVLYYADVTKLENFVITEQRMKAERKKLKSIARKILTDKKIIQAKGMERAGSEDGIKFVKPFSITSL